MDQGAILTPMYAMFALTFVVWATMYALRIPFIQRSGLTPEELATPGKLAEISPARVSNPSDNLKNLFELPVLFYAVVLALHITERVDAPYLWAAWIFVVFRCLHSLMHCTANVVIVRFWLYAAASLALWFMIARSAWQHVAG